MTRLKKKKKKTGAKRRMATGFVSVYPVDSVIRLLNNWGLVGAGNMKPVRLLSAGKDTIVPGAVKHVTGTAAKRGKHKNGAVAKRGENELM